MGAVDSGKVEPIPPGQRITAGALVRDGRSRVLLVEPGYRADWLTPGGSVEPLESPARAAGREVHEELGLELPIGRLLAMRWCHDEGEATGALHLTYDAGVVDGSTIARFRLEPGLRSFRFVTRDAVSTLASGQTADRVAAALDALVSGTLAELGR